MKVCKDCKTSKLPVDFYGRQGECKECTKARTRAYLASPIGRLKDRLRQQKPERKAWVRQFSRKQYKKFALKRSARIKFWNEFRKGTIKKLPCQVCKTDELVEAHHPDYSKPLDVVWLCSLHHKQHHKDNPTL